MRGIWEKLRKNVNLWFRPWARYMRTCIVECMRVGIAKCKRTRWGRGGGKRRREGWTLDPRTIRLISLISLIIANSLSFAPSTFAIEKDDVGLPPCLLLPLFVAFILPLPCFAKSFVLSPLSSFRPEYLFGERFANDLINPWKAQSFVALSLWAEQPRPRKENNYRYRAFCLSPTLHPTFNVEVSTEKLLASFPFCSWDSSLSALSPFCTDGKYQPTLLLAQITSDKHLRIARI